MADFLKTLTNAFTGAPSQEEAAKTQAYLTQQDAATQARIAAAQAQGIGGLETGRTGALSALAGGTAGGVGAIQQMTPQQLAALYGGEGKASGALYGAMDPSVAALRGGVAGVQGAYAPLQAAAQRYGEGSATSGGMYANALGLGGEQGGAAALQAFKQANPGFEFRLQSGIDALTRAGNAAGGGTSGGNLLAEAQRYGEAKGQEEFDRWRAQVGARESGLAGLESGALGQAGAGLSTGALTGGTGEANVYGTTARSLADLYSETGKAGAGVFGQSGASIAELLSKEGQLGAGVWTGTAAQQADLLARLAQTGATATAATYKPYGDASQMAALGQEAGSANLWGLGMNLGKAMAPGLGKAMGSFFPAAA